MSRVEEVREALNRVIDPCSVTAGVPIGLTDMGLVENIHVNGGVVSVDLVPTSVSCLLVGVFAEKAEAQIRGLPWVNEATVSLVAGEDAWTEERMAPSSRQMLEDRRRQSREAARVQILR